MTEYAAGLNSFWAHDQMFAHVAPVDAAFVASERKWGVGRLETLVSPATLLAYRRGWIQWREALQTGDHQAAGIIGPKMIGALAFMEAEATAAGHPPLAVETWEARIDDGRVLVIVHTTAEASAIAQAARLGDDGTLPPDIASAVRHQQEGRELVVWTMAELARVLPTLGLVDEIKRTWPGAVVQKVTTTQEGDAADWARREPVRGAIEGMDW